MKKKLTVLALVVVLIVALASPAQAASISDFSDVKTTDWYFDSVSYAARNNMVNGTSSTTFSPQGTITRGQFITVLGRMACINTIRNINANYTDIAPNTYYSPYLFWAYENGIVELSSKGEFFPERAITREEWRLFFIVI